MNTSSKLVNTVPHSIMDISKILDAFKSDIEIKLNTKYTTFISPQFFVLLDHAGGKNYYIKIHVGDDNYLHARIHEKSDGHFYLENLLNDKRENDEFTTF